MSGHATATNNRLSGSFNAAKAPAPFSVDGEPLEHPSPGKHGESKGDLTNYASSRPDHAPSWPIILEEPAGLSGGAAAGGAAGNRNPRGTLGTIVAESTGKHVKSSSSIPRPLSGKHSVSKESI